VPNIGNARNKGINLSHKRPNLLGAERSKKGKRVCGKEVGKKIGKVISDSFSKPTRSRGRYQRAGSAGDPVRPLNGERQKKGGQGEGYLGKGELKTLGQAITRRKRRQS